MQTVQKVYRRVLCGALLALISMVARGQESRQLTITRPDAVVDLRDDKAIAWVRGQWRSIPAGIVQVPFKAAGVDLKPTGASILTHELQPKDAFKAEFDHSHWPILSASALESRQGTGRLSHVWYRLSVTLPDRIGTVPVAGSTVVLEIVVDDYAEVWVNGKQDLVFGRSAGAAISGYNARNRVVLTHSAMPGQMFQIAVLGINGPLSNLPDNYVWVRSATLDFHSKPTKNPDWQNLGRFENVSPELASVIPLNTKAEKLVEGLQFAEGPAWSPGGYLLFSDPNTNTIYDYQADGNLSVFRTKSGYTGVDIGEYSQPGSNGLAFDRDGRLTICQHGNRRVIRIERNGTTTVLADRFEGKRLNSPNDLVYRSDGTLYFTDPPYGLPRAFEDTRKETTHSGVYVLRNGELKLAAKELKGPNGIAFSPDEKHLYVTNWDITNIAQTKVIYRYDVLPDGSLANGNLFFSMNDVPGQVALDGLKVDSQGNLFVSGPGAVWIISPEAKLLGKLILPELPANFAWGDEDRKTLYMTARTGIYRIRTVNPGAVAFQ